MVPLNLLVCPTLHTDPVTALDANHLLNAVVLGTTSGRVYAYKANHILDAIVLTRPQDVSASIRQPSYAPSTLSNPSLSVNSEALSLSAVIPGYDKGFPLRIDCNKFFPLVSIPPRFTTKYVTCATCGLSVVEVMAPTDEASQLMKPLPLCPDCARSSGQRKSVDGPSTPQPSASAGERTSSDRLAELRSPGPTGAGTNESEKTDTNSYTETRDEATTKPTEHPTKPSSGKKSGKDTEILVPVSPSTFRCKLLTERADEGIRGIYIVPHSAVLPNPNSPLKHGTVCMTVGDLMVRLSVSLRDRHCLNMKFQRRHDMSLCDGTYTLCYKQCSALISPDDPLNCVLLDTYKQKQFLLTGLSISPTAVPFGMDDRHIGWHEVVTEPETLTVVSIAALDTQKTTYNLYLSNVKKPLMLTLSGNRVVCVVNANTIEVYCLLSHDEATHTVRWYQERDNVRKAELEHRNAKNRESLSSNAHSTNNDSKAGFSADERALQEMNMRMGGLPRMQMHTYDEEASWKELEDNYPIFGPTLPNITSTIQEEDDGNFTPQSPTPTPGGNTTATPSALAKATSAALKKGPGARLSDAPAKGSAAGAQLGSWCTEQGRSTDKHKWGPRGSAVSVVRGEYRDAAKELLALSKRLRCVQFVAHKEGMILGMIVENNGEDIITLGSDKKIKLWHKGQLVVKYVNIKGSFISRLPVVMRRVGRVIYYSTDDAVYSVILPIEVEDMNGNLTLEPFVRSKFK